MSKITFEQALRKNWQHFVIDGNPKAISKDAVAGKRCWYRLNYKRNGPACGIGCLIPNEVYQPQWDSVAFTVSTMFRENPKLADLFEDPWNRFWTKLQSAHDGSKNTDDHKNRLLALVSMYLDISHEAWVASFE